MSSLLLLDHYVHLTSASEGLSDMFELNRWWPARAHARSTRFSAKYRRHHP